MVEDRSWEISKSNTNEPLIFRQVIPSGLYHRTIYPWSLAGSDLQDADVNDDRLQCVPLDSFYVAW